MRSLFLFVFSLISFSEVFSQGFTLAVDSVPFISLSSDSGSFSSTSTHIPLGFDFFIDGKKIDTIGFQQSGLLSLGREHFLLMPLSGIDFIESFNGNYVSSNESLSIQLSNFRLHYGGVSELGTLRITFSLGGMIEIWFGPNSVAASNFVKPNIGLINVNNEAVLGNFINNSNTPTFQEVLSGSELPTLTSYPSINQRYRLIPQ